MARICSTLRVSESESPYRMRTMLGSLQSTTMGTQCSLFVIFLRLVTVSTASWRSRSVSASSRIHRKPDEVSAWNASARQALKALTSTLPGLRLDVEDKARVIASVAACGEDNYVEYETRQATEGAKRCLVYPMKPWADLECRCSFIIKHQRRRDNFTGFKAIY